MPAPKSRGFRYGTRPVSGESRKPPKIEFGDTESAPPPTDEGVEIHIDSDTERGGGQGPSGGGGSERRPETPGSSRKPFTGR